MVKRAKHEPSANAASKRTRDTLPRRVSLLQPIPHERLTTQNLLISAAFYERRRGVTKQTLDDLSLLVDLYCLYDGIVVLGRGPTSTVDSELIDTLAANGLIRTELVDLAIAETVGQLATARLGAYLVAEGARIDTAAAKRALGSFASAANAQHGLTYIPDTARDMDVGLEGVKGSAQLALMEPRSYAFARRSFLYVAYAEHTGRIFVPDSARTSLITSMLREDGLFRERLIKGLKAGWQSQEAADQNGLIRLMAPLAAIVLDRASDTKRIGPEIVALREELTPVRRLLRESEQAMHFMTAAETNKEMKKWKAAGKSLTAAFRKADLLIEFEGLLTPVAAFAKAATKWTDFESWAEAFSTLTLAELRQAIARRPVVQLGKLAKRAPGPRRLLDAAIQVFGELRE